MQTNSPSRTPGPAAPRDGEAKPAGLQRIGRYRIVRPLSKGGMALVYEARRESLAGVSPRVAIKLILPEHAGSETFKELFINEARLGASMHHQNLVQIQDFDCDGDTWFLVMEYVEGLTLRRAIGVAEREKLAIPARVIAEIGRQACDGLHYAHRATDEKGRALRLVHRDMKPSNLILNPHGVVKVLDFGISKGRLREERKGSVKGTWGYMAPEQAAGGDVGPTADVFGLAVVLYELASQRPMFVDQNKEEMRRLLKDDHAARMAATLDGATYGPLIGVLVRALQRDPAARYESAEAFGRALSALLPDPITARDEVTRFYQQIEALENRSPKAAGVQQSGGGSGASQASMSPSKANDPAAFSVGGVATFVAGVTLSLTILGAAAVVGLLALSSAALKQGDPGSGPPVAAGTPGLPELDLPTPILRDETTGALRPRDEPAGPAGLDAPGERRAAPAVDRGTGRSAGERRPPAPVGEAPVPEDRPQVVVLMPVPEPDAAPAPAPLPVATGGEVGTLTVDSKQPAEVYIAGQYVSAAPARKDLPPGKYAVSIVASDGRRRSFEVEIEAGGKVKKVWDFDRMEWR